MRRLLAPALSLSLVLGCGGSAGSDAGKGESTETTSGDDSGITDDGLPEETEESGESDETGEGGDVCTPPMDGSYGSAAVVFGSEDYDAGDGPNLDVDWMCTTSGVDASEGLVLTLDCPEGPETVELSFKTSPVFSVELMDGATLRLRHLRSPCFGCAASTWTRLDLENGAHLITAVDAASPDGAGTFELPYAVEFSEGLCEPVPEDCGDREQLALRFAVGGDDAELKAGENHLFENPRETWAVVTAANRLHDLVCEHTASRIGRFLIVDTASS